MRASTDDSDDGPGCVFIIPRQPVSDELPSAGELALIKAFTQPNTANDASLDKAVVTAFTNAGLTDRELTIILGALLVMEKVDLKDANSNFKKRIIKC